MPTESERTRNFDKVLYKLGVDSVPIVGSQMQKNGVTDRIYLAKGLPGGTAYVEYKNPKGKVSDLQKDFIIRARKRGALALVYWYERNYFTDEEGKILAEVNWLLRPKWWLGTLRELGANQEWMHGSS